jgi:hypothetical protein
VMRSPEADTTTAFLWSIQIPTLWFIAPREAVFFAGAIRLTKEEHCSNEQVPSTSPSIP